MPIYRAQVAVANDSVLPRDKIVITPHFSVAQGITFGAADTQQLADDLAVAIGGWTVLPNDRQVEVTIYDAQGTPPVAPVGYAIRNTGAAPVSKAPRELAICLSFYADVNRPRRRGRLFIPQTWMVSAGGAVTMTREVPAATRTKVAELVPIFAGLGGVNVDWVVYSRVDNVARKVTNWWIDDDWDTQRSRGLRTTVRTTGTTSG